MVTANDWPASSPPTRARRAARRNLVAPGPTARNLNVRQPPAPGVDPDGGSNDDASRVRKVASASSTAHR